ncbi:flavodoxin family protein [Desulfuromonas versatilis]|uniref:Flavodoxin family protein n=1 Tax=Desulfuromonas versatilis TaxID=2802975 RepID=A0ABM8HTC6_9BACT|nr:flavodoxin family protein [Desulfuromonas versatilis]BCR04272.1 flavodoxin family protein [Desulfuromonas versatilis]
MKVVAFNGSPRKKGNTSILVDRVFAELQQEGIETEQVNLTGQPLRGCTACMSCFARKDRRCAIDNDPINGWIDKMLQADGIILASPTYFADVTTEMKALIDRAGMVSKANGDMLQRKVGAAVVAVRRGGAGHVFNSLNHFFFIGQMVVPGSSYWNFAFGREIGEVQQDDEGMNTMANLGRNMAWLLKKIAG